MRARSRASGAPFMVHELQARAAVAQAALRAGGPLRRRARTGAEPAREAPCTAPGAASQQAHAPPLLPRPIRHLARVEGQRLRGADHQPQRARSRVGKPYHAVDLAGIEGKRLRGADP